MKVVCDFCNSRAEKKTYVHTSRTVSPYTKELIKVKDANFFECTECGNNWMTEDQQASLETEISKQSRYRLNSEEISLIRRSLPIKTKKSVADFLCLNSKAFSRWENGESEPNDAYDLLLRLVAKSVDNFNFVKNLHAKNFEFIIDDYQLVKIAFGPIVKMKMKTESLDDLNLPITFGYGEAHLEVTKMIEITKANQNAGNDYAMAA